MESLSSLRLLLLRLYRNWMLLRKKIANQESNRESSMFNQMRWFLMEIPTQNRR